MNEQRPATWTLTEIFSWWFRYGVDHHYMVSAPQGNQDEIKAAQKILDSVQEAFAQSEEKDRVAAASYEEASRREAQAKKDEAAAKQR